MDLYLFDFDKTLYGYDFHRRLPALALATGLSQYDLASRWWAAGYEARAESGEWPDAASYLDKFAEITGARLTIAQWQDARLAAMSRIEGSIVALRRASELGTVSLLTNNPSIFVDSLPRLAPDVFEIVGPHLVTSCSLHARKPAAEAYERALARFGAAPENAFFADDNAVNVAAAAALGIHAHQFTSPESLQAAITTFAGEAAMTLLYIFDMDDVLYDYDWRARMAGMTALTGLSLQELRELWWHNEGEWAAEAGVFTSADSYLAAFEAAVGVPIDEAEWVRVRGEAMTARPEAIAAVRRAAELGDVTLLTNNGALTAKHLRELAPELVPVFGDHLFTSSHYSARKPDTVVFERVLAAYGRRASEAFFVDDMAVNVAGAASIGITAHLYTTPEALLAAIEEFAAA